MNIGYKAKEFGRKAAYAGAAALILGSVALSSGCGSENPADKINVVPVLYDAAGWNRCVTAEIAALHEDLGMDLVIAINPGMIEDSDYSGKTLGFLRDIYYNDKGPIDIEIAVKGYNDAPKNPTRDVIDDYTDGEMKNARDWFEDNIGTELYSWVPPFNVVEDDTACVAGNNGFHTIFSSEHIPLEKCYNTCVAIEDKSVYVAEEPWTRGGLKSYEEIIAEIEDVARCYGGTVGLGIYAGDFALGPLTSPDCEVYDEQPTPTPVPKDPPCLTCCDPERKIVNCDEIHGPYRDLLEDLKNSGKINIMTFEEAYQLKDNCNCR